MALLELVIGSMIVTMAAGALALCLGRSSSLRESNRETALALEAAQGTAAMLRGEAFGEVFARYNADPADDPPFGASPGSSFAAPGLNVRPNDPDGAAGAILFPGDGFQLREDDRVDALGTPRDLNGDGVVDAVDHGGDYAVLPVLVRVEWTGASGDRSLELVTTLTRRGGGP